MNVQQIKTVAVTGAAGLALTLALASCHGDGGNAAAQAMPRPLVSVVKLHPQVVPVTAELPGRVVALLEAEVRPQVSGVIQQRLFVEGAEVKAGQALYTIDPASYQAARDSAEASLQRAEATIPAAQARAARNSDLIRLNAISKQEYEDSVDALALARANVATARAALEAARIDLDRTTIRAPISGRIDRSALTPGALVSAGQPAPLTTIHQIDRVNVDLSQSSANLLDLRAAIDAGHLVSANGGVPVRLRLENGAAYPQTGELEFGESSVATSTGTYTLRVTVPNPHRVLLPGMYVRAIVEEGIVPDGYLLPQRAVSRDERGEPVALFVRAGKIEQVILQGAREHGNDWLVTQGLREGDAIVVEGGQQVHAGDAVASTEVVIDAATGMVRAAPASDRANAAAAATATGTAPSQANRT
ncbi:efflux RND transporter periplasmic adaptor subunit [Paraburkholderia ferrariae]|uniref:efflux RND transporter periplasmic adaptor subunit n=1 Tax=Paraburkholderia ferrariae TaxID=386056 RepID=UPI0004862F65|nr:efflux RND transporter periplasmic adaptor subunit [Paraburkholderia ferrariae]